MAGAVATAADQSADASKSPVSSTAIILLNKKLRVGFGFFATAPAQPSAAPIPVGKGTTTTIKPAAGKTPTADGSSLGKEIDSILGGTGIKLPQTGNSPAAPQTAKPLAPINPEIGRAHV